MFNLLCLLLGVKVIGKKANFGVANLILKIEKNNVRKSILVVQM
jgi:hypothetical protein